MQTGQNSFSSVTENLAPQTLQVSIFRAPKFFRLDQATSGVHGTIHPSATTILRALRLPSEDSGLDFTRNRRPVTRESRRSRCPFGL